MSRPVSGVERLWLVADRLAPPFANQLVLEGEGAVDAAALQSAVDRMAGWAVCSARLAGSLKGAKWAAGGSPWRLRRVDGAGWDGRSDRGAPFLRDPLPSGGPLCEVLLVDGPAPRLVIRTLHAFMDGRGTLELAAALFALARGEEAAEIPLAGPTDADLAERAGARPEANVAPDCAPPLPAGEGSGLLWCRKTAALSPRGLLPRLAWAIGEEADPAARCRVDIPVDLRRHAPDLRSTANLTGLVRLSVDSHRERAAPVARIAAELGRRLARAEEGGFPRSAQGLRGLPLGLMERVARGRLGGALFGTTANLSNVGRLDLAGLSGAGLQTRTGFFVPPGSPDLPLFVALTGGGDGVEVCATMPRAFGDHAALDGLLDRLIRRVEESS